MEMWSQRPLTGSWDNELLWLQAMNRQQFDNYSRALAEKQDLWNKWYDFYLKEP
jgi:hypothetical protein